MNYKYYSILKPLVVTGGLLLKSHQGKVRNIPKKSDLPDSKVMESSTAHTIVDDIVQDVVLENLYSHFPDISLNAEEETERVTWFNTDKTKRCFHLDPLDGTLAYIKNRQDYAIGAAISDNLTFIASAIYFPAQDRLFYAEKDRGYAVFNALGKELPFTRPAEPDSTYVQKRCDEYIYILEKLGLSKFDSMSAYYTMISIMEGKATMQMYHMASSHDFGIPSVILEEAGGVCCDLKGDDIEYDKEFNRVPYFLAFFDEHAKDEFFKSV